MAKETPAADLPDDGESPDAPPAGTKERAQRDMQIVLAARRGVSAKTLARTHHITPRRVNQLVKEWDDWDPDILDATTRHRELDQINQLITNAAQLLEDANLVFARAISQKNVNLQIGALRRRQEALEKLAALQQAAGILPRNLGAPAELARVRQLVAAVADVLRDPRVPEELLQRVLELAEAGNGAVLEASARALPAAS